MQINAVSIAVAIRKRSFVSRVKPSVHTGASRKRSFSNKFFNPGETENAGFADTNAK